MKTARRDIIHPDSPSRLHWWSPLLVSGPISVVRVDLTADEAREDIALGWLSTSERSRCESYLPEPRRHFVLCRAALRDIACAELGCANGSLSFGEGEHGKPFARVEGQPAPISFSVSHSGLHGLIAHAKTGRLGVDVEQVAPKRHLNSLIEAVMGPDERRELGEMPEQARLLQFFRLWTCKEALVKALGTGFSTDVSGFQVPLNIRRGESAGVFRFPHLPSHTWRLEDISGDGFAAALASELPTANSELSDPECRYMEVRPEGCKGW